MQIKVKGSSLLFLGLYLYFSLCKYNKIILNMQIKVLGIGMW